jgi:hypothetical protein
MRKYLLATAALLTLAGVSAKADVILDNHLSGTGDNVIFQGLFGNLAIGSFNGQHQGLVDFTDLSLNPNFIGAANGNDIKIANTNNLNVQVFNTAGTQVLQTATDVFSLKGTGDVTAFVTARETDGTFKLFTFDLGNIDPNSQSGFTLTAINGETIDHFRLFDFGLGNITDFEHYRIDVAAAAAVPLPATLPLFGGALALGGLFVRKRKNRLGSIA